jgi:hypothetical protein
MVPAAAAIVVLKKFLRDVFSIRIDLSYYEEISISKF